MGFGQTLANLIRRQPEVGLISTVIPHEFGEQLGGFIVPAVAESYGLVPPVDPMLLKTYYLTDAMAKSAVDSMVDQVCGMGFYTTANEETAVKDKTTGKVKFEQVTSKDGTSRTPKEIIDDFGELVELDTWNQEFVREQLWAGFSITKMLPTAKKIEELAFIPPESIRRVRLDRDTGKVLKVYQQHKGSVAEIDPNDCIFLKNCRDPMEPFGISLFRALASSRTITRTSKTGGQSRTITIPPVFAMKAQMENDMSEGLHRHGMPKIVWPFPNIKNDADLQAELAKLQQMDADYLTNQDVKPIVLEPRINRGFDTFVAFLENRAMEGLETPMLKLLTTPGFTEASAREATRLADFKIFSMQRSVKRVIERHFYAPVLTAAGIDPIQANARLFWGPTEKPTILPADVIQAVREGIIQPVDAQRILRDMGWKITTTTQGVNQ
jgi:hypothetical protein